ncbi:hypothetical protein MCOR29_003792 [Pyricularia oryzae]|nr:hypothetical protein MCOR29_003792 [Pyricularia oryzae]KAI6427058.1 hypothetical protein MCOR24_002639 [Pyricularia oryzae]KAI6498125.1 hypothetical protein MCOR13_006594 [Pyricularia oryzae]
MPNRSPPKNKRSRMHEMLKSRPGDWFRDSDMSLRDQELLRSPSNMFSYDKDCFVRKILDWIVEHDELCKKRIQEAGGVLVGFPETAMPSSVSPPYQSMIVNVNIRGAPGGSFDWGYLTTSPQNVRIFKGPEYTCSAHSWDAMILKDCYANTSNLRKIEAIADRRWDILAMKLCEDIRAPWLVFSIRDPGPNLVTNGICYTIPRDYDPLMRAGAIETVVNGNTQTTVPIFPAVPGPESEFDY